MEKVQHILPNGGLNDGDESHGIPIRKKTKKTHPRNVFEQTFNFSSSGFCFAIFVSVLTSHTNTSIMSKWNSCAE